MKRLLGPNPSQEWIDFLDFYKQKVEVKAGQIILKEGEAMEGLFFVVNGKVKVMHQERGAEHLIRLAGNDSILGHRGFGLNWQYPVTAIALVDSELEFLPLSAFNTIAKTNANFSCSMMMFFAEELRTTEQQKQLMPVAQRVAITILLNLEAFGYEEGSKFLSYSISRKDIASHAGTTYESVVRTLAGFSKNGIVLLDGKRVGIEDLSKLKEIANGQA